MMAFDSNLLHSSAPNESDAWRTSVIVAFNAACHHHNISAKALLVGEKLRQLASRAQAVLSRYMYTNEMGLKLEDALRTPATEAELRSYVLAAGPKLRALKAARVTFMLRRDDFSEPRS